MRLSFLPDGFSEIFGAAVDGVFFLMDSLEQVQGFDKERGRRPSRTTMVSELKKLVTDLSGPRRPSRSPRQPLASWSSSFVLTPELSS